MPPKSVKKMKLTFKHSKINTDMSRTNLLEDFSMKQVNEPHDTAPVVNPGINLCATVDDGPNRNVFDHDPMPTPSTSELLHTRKELELKAWQNLRPKLLSAYLESIVPTSSTCCICSIKPQTLVVCCDCVSIPAMCEQCAVETHSINLQFHSMWQFKDGVRTKFTYCSELVVTHHTCSNRYMKSMSIFDMKGAMHSSQVTFCRCVSEMESLIQKGFWPSSARDPTCAINMKLLELITSLILETQSSVKSICHSFKWFNGMHNKDISYLYKILTNETLEEFRHFKFMIRSLQSEALNLDDGSSCPACPKSDGEVFISLDANFGLVRKKNSGHSLEPPKHSRYFIEQVEVDQYVDAYAIDEVPKEDVECSNFQTINTIRAKNKVANLESKGVFGSACRHEIPILFLSMRHGERYAYPVLILEKLMHNRTIHHHIIYDIACKFEGHIKVIWNCLKTEHDIL